MPELCRVVAELKPGLVVIDPLFKFVRVMDEKAYAQTCLAIEPLLTLPRETGAHVLLVHHNGKAERADATEAILGSTAIFGGVDAALILKRSDRYRTLQSCQRYGTDWPETVLDFDTESRGLSLGEEKSQADAGRISQQILFYLNGKDLQTREEIEEHVEGDTGPKRKALRLLVEQGKVVREGTGIRGDPFRYRLLFSCLQDIGETSKQETESGHKPTENATDMFVCASSSNLFVVCGSVESEKHQHPDEDGEGEVRL